MKKKTFILVLTLVLAFMFSGQVPAAAQADQNADVYRFATDPNNIVWNQTTHTAEYIEINFDLPAGISFSKGKYAVIRHSLAGGDNWEIISSAKLLTNSAANQYRVDWNNVVFERGQQQLAIFDGDPSQDSSSILKAIGSFPYIISDLTPATLTNPDSKTIVGSLATTFSLNQQFAANSFSNGMYAVLRYASNTSSKYTKVKELTKVEDLGSDSYRVIWDNANQPGRYEVVLFNGNSEIKAIGFYEYNSSQDNPNQNKMLRATAGNGYITLDWDAAANTAGLDGYYLYRGTSPGGEDASPLFDFPINDLTYKDTKVVNGTTYYYILKPCYNKGAQLGTASNEASATPIEQTSGTIILTIGNPYMKVNGQDSEIDPGQGTAPTIVSGRTFLPIRAVIEAMGGNVSWDGSDSKVTIVYNQQTINLWIGKTTATVNGTTKNLDANPYISDTDRTMIPLRFVAENLGCNVTWNGPEQIVTINYGK